MSAGSWLLLFLVQAVWAGSYVAAKTAGAELPVGVVVFLRYGLASAGILCMWLVLGFPRFRRRDLWVLAGLGVLDFWLSPLLQILGLGYTQAIDASVMIAFEPIVTVLVAAVALRERPSRATWIALAVATAGIFLLSGGAEPLRTGSLPLRLLGNLVFAASLICEASVTVAGRPFTQRYKPHDAIGAMIVVGFLATTAIHFPEIARTDFGSVSRSSWISVLFLAFGCSIFAYTFWYRVIREVPVNRVALSLFFQPVLGTFYGLVLLGETLDAGALVGALLICATLVWWQRHAGAR
jgi:drug/metabolite transporter (DMT)-like permease